MPSKKISGMSEADLANLDLVTFIDDSETNLTTKNKKSSLWRLRKYLKVWHGEASGPASATYTLTILSGLGLSDGYILSNNDTYFVRFQNANTAGDTLTITGIGAKAMVDPGGNALTSGDIQAASYHILSYDSVNDRFIIQSLNRTKPNISTKTASYTVTISDYTIVADATSADVILTLPDATTCTGKEYEFVRKDSSINSVELNTTASQTINGSALHNMPTQYDTVRIKSDGTNWYKF